MGPRSKPITSDTAPPLRQDPSLNKSRSASNGSLVKPEVQLPLQVHVLLLLVALLLARLPRVPQTVPLVPAQRLARLPRVPARVLPASRMNCKAEGEMSESGF